MKLLLVSKRVHGQSQSLVWFQPHWCSGLLCSKPEPSVQLGGSAAIMICKCVQNSSGMDCLRVWDVAGEQIDFYFLNLLVLEGGVWWGGVSLVFFPHLFPLLPTQLYSI